MIPDTFKCYSTMKKHDLCIVYSGPIWSGGIEGISETLKKRLEFDELPLNASQSVFSIFVEQMNNMLMYSAEKTQFSKSENQLVDVPEGIFILGVKEKTYFIQSGNVINNNSIETIKSRIDYLNTLDKKELRQYYKEQMKSENTNHESKGAGLGFIEIARRADPPIEYSFVPFGDGLSFFTMFVKIGQGGN